MSEYVSGLVSSLLNVMITIAVVLLVGIVVGNIPYLSKLPFTSVMTIAIASYYINRFVKSKLSVTRR